jgi:putative transposase
MSRKYKFRDNDKLYFISFAIVNWIDVFIRNEYRDELLQSLKFCQANKNLEIYAWCIMTSHMHLIIGSSGNKMENIVRDFKSYTSGQMKNLIKNNAAESRKEWIIWMMERAGRKNSNNNNWQFWQQDNHPIELNNESILRQKLNYLHNNPVESGFVIKAEEYLYSSAMDYYGGKGLLDITVLEGI